MDLTFSAEDEAFRQAVRQLAETVPPNLARRVRLGRLLSNQRTEAWKLFAELSALGAWFDPEAGAYGGGPDDTATVVGGDVARGRAA